MLFLIVFSGVFRVFYVQNHVIYKNWHILLLNLYRDGEGERKRRETSMCERNINQLPLVHAPTWKQAHNPGMCPHQESNQGPFTLQDNIQPTELYQLRWLFLILLIKSCDFLILSFVNVVYYINQFAFDQRGTLVHQNVTWLWCIIFNVLLYLIC